MRRLLPLLVCAACGPSEDDPPATSTLLVRWEVDDGRFLADLTPGNELFTLAAADMDHDGDPDVILQRHHLARTEVFENVGGYFNLVNPREQDDSGLYDNPGVPDLFAELEPMQAAVDAHGQPGLYIWHDENRGGLWRFESRSAELDLRVRVNQPISSHAGMKDVVDLDAYSLEAHVPATRSFSLGNPLVASQLVVEVLSPDPVPMFLGRTLAPYTGHRVELWKNDPHGLAWVDQLGGPERELFVTRGGLTGLLTPPLDPKQDQLFEWSGDDLLYRESEGLIPRDYCRGRQVTWIDIDADGVDELFLSCTATPNQILDRDANGVFTDVAGVWGAASVDPEAFTWVDVDLDGRLDLVQNQTESLEVLMHRSDHFAVVPGSAIGLISPVAPSGGVSSVFNPFTLQAFDYDRDGDLDVWASHFGPNLSVALLRNEGGTFTDATREVGLGNATGFSSLVPVDMDRDGWIDLYAVDSTGITFHRNLRGTGFREVGIDGVGMVDAVSADIDGDGRADLVGHGPGGVRRVVFDRHEHGGELVLVEVRAPLGSLVRGHYVDGSILVQVHGGATSRYSQVAEPLEFGSGTGDDRLLAVSLQRPGGEEEPWQSVTPGAALILE